MVNVLFSSQFWCHIYSEWVDGADDGNKLETLFRGVGFRFQFLLPIMRHRTMEVHGGQQRMHHKDSCVVVM